MHQLQEFVRLHREGVGVTTIARRMGWDRKTERKYRRRLERAKLLLGPTSELPSMKELKDAIRRPRQVPRQERSSIEEHRAFVGEKVAAGLAPAAIYGLLMERPGFRGSLSAVKRMVAACHRAQGPRPEDVVIPVHTGAGEQAQVDFGYVGMLADSTGRLRKAWVFVMVLSHSRLIYACVVFSQDVPTWLDCHRRAFVAFEGVPKTIVPDNLKAAVIKAAFSAAELGEVNRTYRDFARFHGFMIDPTPAYSPEKKGKVESAVKYVKKAFFEPRRDELTELEATNKRLEKWIAATANQRVHGTTGHRPADVWNGEERARLLGLPDTPFVPVLWHRAKVGRDSHVTFRGRFYSAPWAHLGKESWLRIHGAQLSIYVDDKRVADHRTDGPTRWSTVQDHLPEGRRDLALRDPETWYRRARTLGDVVERYARAVMASDEVVFPLRRLQSIILQLEKLSVERAQSVAAHAARFGCYRPDGVRRIVARELDLETEPVPFVSASWAASSRFKREASEFLARHTGAAHASA